MHVLLKIIGSFQHIKIQYLGCFSPQDLDITLNFNISKGAYYSNIFNFKVKEIKNFGKMQVQCIKFALLKLMIIKT